MDAILCLEIVKVLDYEYDFGILITFALNYEIKLQFE